MSVPRDGVIGLPFSVQKVIGRQHTKASYVT